MNRKVLYCLLSFVVFIGTRWATMIVRDCDYDELSLGQIVFPWVFAALACLFWKDRPCD